MSASMVSRREFIRFGASAAVTLPVLLQGCSGPFAAPPSNTVPASASGGGNKSSQAASNSALPAYIPFAGGPKADFPAASQDYCDGYNGYPTNPFKALPDEPPGSGGIITVLSSAALPLPTPYDQNPAWQAVNKALNANVQFNIVSVADYPTKLATTMAGGDLPDIISFISPASISTITSIAPGAPQFLQAQAADLTPYLAGDSARDYPFLANIPTHCWANSGCAYQGQLFLVPYQRPLEGNLPLKNATIYDAELGQDYQPKNADDFKRILQAFTHPQEGHYGIGGGGATLFLTNMSAMFGAPNNWRLETTGQLTSTYETPEFKEATAYVRDLWAAGVFHPDSPTKISRTDYQAGKFVIYWDTYNGWQDTLRIAGQQNPAYEFKPLPLFPAHDGQKAQFFTIAGIGGASALKKASPDRIQELLRVLNYLASPFGSQEALLLEYGLPNLDYTLDGEGNLTVTPRSNTDANYVPWKYTAQHPFVFYAPDVPNYGGMASAAEHLYIPSAVPDPTWGYVSPTATTKGVALTRSITDGLAALVLGRQPMSDYEQIVTDWLTGGGEQIRQEFMDAIAASK